MKPPPLRFARENLQFHRELTRATQAWLEQHGEHRFANGAMIAKAVLLALLAASCGCARPAADVTGWAGPPVRLESVSLPCC